MSHHVIDIVQVLRFSSSQHETEIKQVSLRALSLSLNWTFRKQAFSLIYPACGPHVAVFRSRETNNETQFFSRSTIAFNINGQTKPK